MLYDSTKVGDGDAVWSSPWGQGRPGWHIECSAMAGHTFGSQLDVHTGGIDLKFPHHNNEIAQCEAHACADGWTRYWLHSGHLHIDGRKMSKSLKNFITIKEFLTHHSPSQLRLFCLLAPYQTGIDYTNDRMV